MKIRQLMTKFLIIQTVWLHLLCVLVSRTQSARGAVSASGTAERSFAVNLNRF